MDKLTDALKDAGEKAKNLKSVLSEAKITQFE
jgi:hypothetical protein